jgi:hypothetical protein
MEENSNKLWIFSTKYRTIGLSWNRFTGRTGKNQGIPF